MMAVSGVFMISYGSFRFITEFFRTPDAHLGFIAFDWMTMGQLLSLPMIVVGVVLYWLAMKSVAEYKDPDGRTEARMLFDHVLDAQEDKNVAEHKENEDIVRNLSRQLNNR